MKSVFRERWLGWNGSLEKTRVKFITSIISFFVVMGLLSPFFISSIKLQSQRNAIETVVSQANLNDRDPISVALLERGEVTTSLGVFKSTQLRSMGDELFDRNGKIIDGTVISDVLLAPNFPTWAPMFMVERPSAPVMVFFILLVSTFLAIWLNLFLPYACICSLAGAIVIPSVQQGYFSVAFVTAGITALVLSFALLIQLLIVLREIGERIEMKDISGTASAIINRGKSYQSAIAGNLGKDVRRIEGLRDTWSQNPQQLARQLWLDTLRSVLTQSEVEVFAMPLGIGQSQISIASSPEVMQVRRNADMARRKQAAAMMEALRPSWELGVRQTMLDKAGRRLDQKATQGFGRENK